MNYLFSVGYLSGTYDANIDIAIAVAGELEKIGHQCLLLLYSDKAIAEYRTVLNGREFCVLPINVKRNSYRKKYRNSGKSKLFYSILHPVATIKFKLEEKNDFLDSVSLIDSKIKDNNIDCLISLVSPFNASQVIIKNVRGVRKIIYQLDPWGFHESLDRNGLNQRRADEMELFGLCDHVFTTDILYRLYKKDSEYRTYINKISPLHFPGFRKKNVGKKPSMEQFDAEYPIVYTGTIDDEYRDPKAIFDMLIKTKELYDLDLKIYLYGRTQLSDTVAKYCQIYKDTVIVRDEVDADTASAIMNSNGVFLLNINNKLKNQSPSKLIDYISTGNPIINLIKYEEDISPSILENYDYKFSIYENREFNFKSLFEFLKDNKNKKMDLEEIRKLYYEYTPAFIAEKIAKELRDEECSV